MRQKAAGTRKKPPPQAVIRDPRECVRCGATFVPKQDRSKFCSPACGRDSLTPCSREGCERGTRAKGLCNVHYKAEYGANWSKGRPENRRRLLRTKTARRRAAQRDPEAERIDRDEIGDRDGWRCGLCGRRVNKSLLYPHPMSPSLDHIVPLARGGKHARINVQIAHLTCNVTKKDKGGGEQLLLIG